MKDGQMASQALIDAALAYKAAMQLKTARRNQLSAKIEAEGTAAQKAQWAVLVARDVALHEDIYDFGTDHLPVQFPQGGGT